MTYNAEKRRRRSIRLKEYDYSQPGYYYLTICTNNRECIFGEIREGEVVLNEYGIIVKNEWQQSFKIRKEINSDSYIIMPNHIHGIILIDSFVGANGGLPEIDTIPIEKEINTNIPIKRANCHSPLRMKSKSISSFISGFKSAVSRKIGLSVWQRNYYEHIIRNEEELNQIRQYIKNNPFEWKNDEYNPEK